MKNPSKGWRYLALTFMLVGVLGGTAKAEPQTPQEPELSIRTVFLHSGPGPKLMAFGACGTSLYTWGEVTLNPCLYGAATAEEVQEPSFSGQVGFGFGFKALSINLAVDSAGGEFYWGFGFEPLTALNLWDFTD